MLGPVVVFHVVWEGEVEEEYVTIHHHHLMENVVTVLMKIQVNVYLSNCVLVSDII